MDHKTGGRVNHKEKRYQISLYSHIPCILRKWGFKQKVPRKVHVNTASVEEKEAFKKRPIVRVTGSHKHSCIFGAVCLGGKQLFRQYDKFNGDTFLDYLKKLHTKFPRCYLFMDKASPHYKSKKVLKYFEENRDTLIPIYLPTASPEFMVMEEVWKIAKGDLLVLKYYKSFADLKEKISEYFRTKRFGLDMRNYLLREVR